MNCSELGLLCLAKNGDGYVWSVSGDAGVGGGGWRGGGAVAARGVVLWGGWRCLTISLPMGMMRRDGTFD
jgi:hypothetical protein